jgi:PAS domain S-box-containing protein
LSSSVLLLVIAFALAGVLTLLLLAVRQQRTASPRDADQQAATLSQQAELLDLAHDAIMVWEMQSGQIRFWNKGSEELHGWDKIDVLGRTPQAILQTQFPIPLAEINAILVSTGRWEGELVHTRRDGSTVVVASRWALQVDKHGNPRAVLGINTDITSRKQAEAALRQSEARKGAILEAALDCIISLDAEGRVTEFNPAAETTFGHRRATVLGVDLADLIIPARYQQEHRAGLQSLLMVEQPQAINGRLDLVALRSDGTEFPVEVTIVRSEFVDEFSFTVYLRDITERKQAEVALLASQERYRRQYKGIPIPTYSWRRVDDDFVMEDCNEAAATSSGNLSMWLGKRASECLDTQAVGMLRECFAQQRALPRREITRPHRVTGEEQSICASYVFVPPEMVMVHIEDVTEARRAERQQASLAQSEKLRALGQMASGIAHDLNQSLMLISSYGDLARSALDQDPLNLEELRVLLTTATQAALDGGETVKRLLMFTRNSGERGREPVNLAHVLEEAAHLTAPRWRDAAQAEGRPIVLHVQADAQPTIEGSPARIREVMTNLIFNAVDALPEGGAIGLRVALEGALAVVEVSDSGDGMSAEVQARVFEPFFTTKGQAGTGLGLAMVFGIVKQHDGEITVRSSPGAGTTLRMTFPSVQAPLQLESLRAALESTAARRPERALRVLAVDDEPAMTKAVSRMLRPAGHVVKMAASGEEALAMLAAEPFDVVVSDMGMGAGMNGWELVAQVKRDWPAMRFLLATGWGAAIDPAEARSKGVESVLAKPYVAVDLLRALAA